ncbi:PAS domain-containing protein [Nocardioides daphniae]|uniref:PAS domain-containing protein n=1 Tax=Nocardioides daphniae TaxID=402297 RepID=UPI001E2B7464|nr:PAS domain-containing protein [Nocardioides daphniae]
MTKTDLQGRLTYANDVFLHFSALTEDEAIGQPHNLIRHPEMPGGVFALLWERVQAGKEIFAYVKNLGHDGVAYWVFAHVTPTFDGTGAITGYHSMRRAPRRSALPAVERVYAQMRALEAGKPARPAAQESLEWLVGQLAEQDMDYDAWVWSLEAAA